jgi:transposase
MLPSHKTRILIATQPVDFRKGHDGLAALVQSTLKEDPFTGTVFVILPWIGGHPCYGFRARRGVSDGEQAAPIFSGVVQAAGG